MRTRWKLVGKIAGGAALLLVAAAVGFALASQVVLSTGGSSASAPAIMSQQATTSEGSVGAPAAKDAVAAGSASAPAGGQAVTPQRLVITNASMQLEVKNASETVGAVRAIATANGAEIAQLEYNAGGGSQPSPVPLDASGRVSGGSLSPASALVTLRVPADRLPQVEAAVAGLGTVVSQAASQSDVTQQHIDMTARLRNLRAEEAQLRAFYSKARTVDDLLSIQQQLSTVRGEIESMQAQVDYLERQAALATLTVSISEPGPVVRPSGTSWGFLAAVTAGVQAAAALMRAFVTVAIALSPVILVGLLLWAVSRIVRRSRKPPAPDESADDDSSAQPTDPE